MSVGTCEFLVLGGGRAGRAAAVHAADLGRDVLLVEADPRHPVLAAPPAGVRVLLGRARFGADGIPLAVDPDGGETLLRAPHVLVAVGDAPRHPVDAEPDGVAVLSADEFWTPPREGGLLVAGGGPTGVAAALRLAAAGAAVTLAQRGPRLLPTFDRDLSAHLAAVLGACGVTVRTGRRLAAARTEGSGAEARLRRNRGEEEILPLAAVILAVGRRPRTEELGPLPGAVVMDRHGRIQTDPCQETARHGLYAAGAVTGAPTTARIAAAEGRVAAAHAAGAVFRPVRWEILPRVVSAAPGSTAAAPGFAAAGLSEDEALARGHDAAAVTRAAGEDFCKLVWDRETGRLLGAHLCGSTAAGDVEAAAILLAAGLPPDAWRDVAAADGCLAAALAVQSAGAARG